MEEKNYSKVDVLTYVSEKIKEGSLEFREAVKFRRIYAVQGNTNDYVQTVLADGTVETEPRMVGIDEKTGEANWVVKNVCGPEQWVISDSVFKRKYEVEDEQAGVYKPKGKPMLAAQVSEDIEITPPMWGGDIQRVNAGGFLLMDPTNPTDIYAIGETEFHDTYTFTGSEKQKKLS